jgi:hypothetical protein
MFQHRRIGSSSTLFFFRYWRMLLWRATVVRPTLSHSVLTKRQREEEERMRKTHAALGLLIALVFIVERGSAAEKRKAAPTDSKLITSAMSAAPASVAKGATIVAMAADGSMRTIRKGTNGFTCMPDNPTTPGPDPMCLDKNAMEWANAWMSHKTPPEGKVGFMYMLAGGTDASNTDPYATKPSASNHWIKTGPHIMVVGGDAAFYDSYPKSADPDTSVPYVMWAGTPYQHLMAPVK